MSTRITKIFSTLTLLCFLFGCSQRPSDDVIQEQIFEYILSDGGDSVYKIENFKKINGFEESDKVYLAKVQYDLVFQKSFRELEIQSKLNSQGGLSVLQTGVILMALRMQYGNFQKGYRTTKSEEVTFINTEKGWRVKT